MSSWVNHLGFKVTRIDSAISHQLGPLTNPCERESSDERFNLAIPTAASPGIAAPVPAVQGSMHAGMKL